MTREEAIKKLKSQQNVVCNDCLHAVGWCESHCKFSEAIDMAIEVLKQPEPCGDVVSRQAAIDALQKCRKHCIDPFDSYHIDIQDAENQLSKVPTIQTEPSIPLSWIEKHIEWHKSLDNVFAELVAAHISAMVNKWRDEQNETD